MSKPGGSKRTEKLKQSAEYELRLYISGATQLSLLAVGTIKKLSERYLAGKYSLEIIDINQQPAKAQQMQIIATPTLIRIKPLPIKRLIGDMSNTAAVLTGLDIRPL